jgi:hypothetical protein
MSIREKYVAEFGEEQAKALEQAADTHKNGIHDNKGSDPFKWAILIAIGYECSTRDAFKEYHGISVPTEKWKQWVKEHAELSSHDGDCDYITLLCGLYNEYVPEKAEVQP